MMDAIGFGIRNLSYKDNITDPIRVAGYARCSTQHEAQLDAIESQQEWLRNYCALHPNWILTDLYVDRGITGTSVDKRPNFKRLLEDAQNGEFNLIVCRELCRFSRNNLDTLRLVRELGEKGIECFFINDNIWSLDGEGELRISIMSSLAQEESRKAAERVYSGLKSVRDRHTLLGNGNILGYRLIRGSKAVDNTYVIVDEDADTIRMIYSMYLQGSGLKEISKTLVKNGRKNAMGKVVWDETRVRRILRNRTYAGYIGYNKSNTVNYLKHNRRNNLDRHSHDYVKGNFPEIVSDEDWQEVQNIIDSRTVIHNGKRMGMNPYRSLWVSKLKCSCGKSYRRYHWRTNQNKVPVYGYACKNVVTNGSKEQRKTYVEGQDLDGMCNVASFPEWKLELMFITLCRRLIRNPTKTKEKLSKLIRMYFEPVKSNAIIDVETIERNLRKTENRLESLWEMRMDESISSEEFKNKKAELEKEKENLLLRLNDVSTQEEAERNSLDEDRQMSEIAAAVEKLLCFDGESADNEFVNAMVSRVTPCPGYSFKWYMNLRNVEPEKMKLCDSFSISYDEASKYRKTNGSFLRKGQWNDLLVEVYT